MRHPKKDPVFGNEALQELDDKITAKIKPDPPLKRKRWIKNTQFFKEKMHYLYLGSDEEI